MTFAEQLQELRHKAGMTQAALANATGLSLGIIRDYEQGRKEPALRSAFKLAEVLGVSIEVFKTTAAAQTTTASRSSKPRKVTPPGKIARETAGGQDAPEGKKRGKRK